MLTHYFTTLKRSNETLPTADEIAQHVTEQHQQPGGTAGSPDEDMWDAGGLRRDTTLEVEAGYYSDMLNSLQVQANEKSLLEGKLYETEDQLQKERREAAYVLLSTSIW